MCAIFRSLLNELYVQHCNKINNKNKRVNSHRPTQ